MRSRKKELTLLLSHYSSSGGANSFNSKRGGRLYEWKGEEGKEEDVGRERNCGRNNNNKTAMEKRAAELVERMQKHKRGSNIRRIRERVED